MARATVTDVKIRFNGNKTDKPNSFCIFFGAKNKNYVPFKDLNKWLINNPSQSGADFDGDTITTKNMEETTMIHKRKSLGIKNIIFNGPATIIFWDDNTKTVVKCGEGDVFDPEKGIAMAVMKRALGTNETDSNYLDKIQKYINEYREKEQLDIAPQDILTCVSNAVDTASVILGQKMKDVKVRRLKSEAMDIRTQMMVSGATHWELETFDRFCRKYVADTADNMDKEATNGKKE